MADPVSQDLDVTLHLPPDLSRFELPEGVQKRLQTLLDTQDRGEDLSEDERIEAEGLVDLAEMLSLLRLRATRPAASND